MPIPANKMELFLYIILRVLHLTYTWGLIWFSNCAGLSRMIYSYRKYFYLRKVLQGRIQDFWKEGLVRPQTQWRLWRKALIGGLVPDAWL